MRHPSRPMLTIILIRNQALTLTEAPRIVVLYFITTVGTGPVRFRTQIDLIQTTGLYTACERMLCFVAADTYVHDTLMAMPKCTIINSSRVGSRERVSQHIQRVHQRHRRAESSTYIRKVRVIQSRIAISSDWCALCNHFTMVRWRLNVRLLRHYTCVGVNLCLYPLPHFSGNWWATGRHLMLLHDVGHRCLDPEMYLLNNIKHPGDVNARCFAPNPLCLYRSFVGHAAMPFAPSNYCNLSDATVLERIATNYALNNCGDDNATNRSRISLLVDSVTVGRSRTNSTAQAPRRGGSPNPSAPTNVDACVNHYRVLRHFRAHISPAIRRDTAGQESTRSVRMGVIFHEGTPDITAKMRHYLTTLAGHTLQLIKSIIVTRTHDRDDTTVVVQVDHQTSGSNCNGPATWCGCSSVPDCVGTC